MTVSILYLLKDFVREVHHRKVFGDFFGAKCAIWAHMGPWAYRGQGPWAHGPGPILKIFDFFDFLDLSAQYVFLDFWISDGPF